MIFIACLNLFFNVLLASSFYYQRNALATLTFVNTQIHTNSIV